jgi:arginine-tRNA-protein transferase
VSAPSIRSVVPTEPPELVIHDELAPCPYLPERTSRLPLRLPIRGLDRAEFDERLVRGDRRQGLLLYSTQCPDCRACEPIRLDVERFAPNRSQRRTWQRGRDKLRMEIGPLEATEDKVLLYNRHKVGRDLVSGEKPIDLYGYRAFLGDSSCESFELRYFAGQRLVGVAVTDRSADALSAVYCFYDPDYEPWSPGVFSVLTQLDLCRTWGLRYLYLGFYIRDCGSMAYKARYLPHERLREGEWLEYGRGPAGDADPTALVLTGHRTRATSRVSGPPRPG